MTLLEFRCLRPCYAEMIYVNPYAVSWVYEVESRPGGPVPAIVINGAHHFIDGNMEEVLKKLEMAAE